MARNSALRCCILPSLMCTSSNGMPASLAAGDAMAGNSRQPPPWQLQSGRRRQQQRAGRQRHLRSCATHLQNSRQVREGCDMRSTNSLSCVEASIVSGEALGLRGTCRSIAGVCWARPGRPKRCNAQADSARHQFFCSGVAISLPNMQPTWPRVSPSWQRHVQAARAEQDGGLLDALALVRWGHAGLFKRRRRYRHGHAPGRRQPRAAATPPSCGRLPPTRSRPLRADPLALCRPSSPSASCASGKCCQLLM